jgi:hypothetical protein
MLTLSSTLLFTTSVQSSIIPFQPTTKQLIENKIDNGMVQDLRLSKLQKQYEEQKLENEKKAKEEIKEQKKNEPQWQEFILTFYTGLDEENFSGCGGRNCLNQPLERGMIANNSMPIGTKIFLDNDYGVRTVADKGSSRFNDSNRIDMYVSQRNGETKEQWKRRAESYGIRHIWGYVING